MWALPQKSPVIVSVCGFLTNLLAMEHNICSCSLRKLGHYVTVVLLHLFCYCASKVNLLWCLKLPSIVIKGEASLYIFSAACKLGQYAKSNFRRNLNYCLSPTKICICITKTEGNHCFIKVPMMCFLKQNLTGLVCKI